MNSSDSISPSVYVITHEFYPKRGGIATFTEEVARAAAGLNFQVEVFAQSAAGAEEKSWPFRLRRMSLRGTHDIGCILRMAVEFVRRRRSLRRTIVFVPEPGPMYALMLLLPFRTFVPRNLVISFHGSEVLKFAANPLTRSLARRLIDHAQRVGATTAYSRRLIETHFPNAAGKIVLTPCALRSDVVTPTTRPNPRHSKTILLTVSRLHPRKGHRATFQALRALPPEQRRTIEYWIVGSPSKSAYLQDLQQMARQCDFPVKFWGDLSDAALSEVYAQADVFIMTSIRHGNSVEGFGLVYLEASAHGLPVVAHDVGGVSEAVADGQSGLLVSPDRPEDLVTAIHRLVSDPDLRIKLGTFGRDWSQRPQWSEAARAIVGRPAVDA